jgi:hypothetical protein
VEKLWQAANAVMGEGSTKAEELVDKLKGALWDGYVEEVQEVLDEQSQRKPLKGKKAKEDFRDATRYIENHKEKMRYDEYREGHWPIGSGPAEAACKVLVEARMKRSGMNWSELGAEHMLLLRARYCTELSSILYPQH